MNKLRYTGRIAKHILYLPSKADSMQAYIEKTDSILSNLSEKVAALERLTKIQHEELEKLNRTLNSVDTHVNDLQRVALAQKNTVVNNMATEIDETKSVNNTISDNHSHDAFYKKFEDTFRGDEASITERIKEHIPLLESLPQPLRKKPIIDIGCGRGEFLAVAKANKFKAIGVDMNKEMVERAKSLGFHAVENDAYSYLSELSSNSLAAVTGFHIVEHIPFENLLDIFRECYRTVAVGGFVMFETPNPENITVGACTFYMDPSHIKPIPPPLLAFALESVGFDTEIQPLHPDKADRAGYGEIMDVYNLIHGPRDYAVIARK